MGSSSGLLHLLRARAMWAVVLCYALLLQAALSPAASLASDPTIPGSPASVLCVVDQDAHGAVPHHHDGMSCCLPAAHMAFGGPAVLAGTPVVLPSAPGRLVGAIMSVPSPRAPPSVDLRSRPARAPPVLAA